MNILIVKDNYELAVELKEFLYNYVYVFKVLKVILGKVTLNYQHQTFGNYVKRKPNLTNHITVQFIIFTNL